MIRKLLKVSLLALVLFIAFKFLFGITKIKWAGDVDTCSLTLTDEQAKHRLVEELFSNAEFRKILNNVETGVFVRESKWTILSLTPPKRAEANSDYDLIRYQIIASFRNKNYELDLDSCDHVTSIGPNQ